MALATALCSSFKPPWLSMGKTKTAALQKVVSDSTLAKKKTPPNHPKPPKTGCTETFPASSPVPVGRQGTRRCWMKHTRPQRREKQGRRAAHQRAKPPTPNSLAGCFPAKETQNISSYGLQSTGLVWLGKGEEAKPGTSPLPGSTAGPSPALLQKVKPDRDSPERVCCGHARNHSKFPAATGLTAEAFPGRRPFGSWRFGRATTGGVPRDGGAAALATFETCPPGRQKPPWLKTDRSIPTRLQAALPGRC